MHVNTFAACHLLTYGTDYDIRHYVDELRPQIATGSRFPFPHASDQDFNEDHYNRSIRQLWADSNFSQAAWLYLDSRRMARPLRDAAQVLQDAAIRGDVTGLARRTPDAPLTALSPAEWLDRGWLQILSGVLYQQREVPMRTIDWWDLTFDRREIAVLRDARWHSSGQGAEPAYLERPSIKMYATAGTNLRRAVESVATPPTKGAILKRLAALYLSDFGEDAYPKGEAALARTIKAQLGGDWPLDSLLGRARRAGWEG